MHNAVRDTIAHVTRKAVGPHVPIVTEPRGYAVGYASDHRGGPDILVIDAKTVIDVKSTNPNAKRNQNSLSKDIAASLKGDQRANARPGSQDTHDLSRNANASGVSTNNTVNDLIAATESGQDAEAAQGVGHKLTCVPVSTVAAVHGCVWDAVEPAIQKDDEADQRCTIGWSITGARSMLMQATIMATVRAAAHNALQCARAVCLDARRMKPDIGRSAWPAPPPLFQFDFHLDDDLDAISQSHDIDTSDENDVPHHTADVVGYQPTVHEAEFQAPNEHASERHDDEAGPATTLDERFGAIRTA